jgi:hypothetical protein
MVLFASRAAGHFKSPLLGVGMAGRMARLEDTSRTHVGSHSIPHRPGAYMWLQPEFFSVGAWQCGQGLVVALMAACVARSSRIVCWMKSPQLPRSPPTLRPRNGAPHAFRPRHHPVIGFTRLHRTASHGRGALPRMASLFSPLARVGVAVEEAEVGTAAVASL